MLLALLSAVATALPQQPEPALRALLVTGANNHDWQYTAPQIAAALRETGRFDVTVTDRPADDLAGVAKRHAAGELDVIVLDYNGPRWGEAAERGFLDAVRAGCGVVVVHAADNAFEGWTDYELLVGHLWRKGTGHGAYHPFDVVVVDHDHPVTHGMEDLRLHPDELYHRLVHAPGAEHKVLMSAFSEPKTGGTGRHEPMATAGAFGKGRVFHTPLGHVWRNTPGTHATWGDPQLRLLLARGAEWAATGAVTLPTTPFNRLSTAEREAGFELLFDGRSLEHWKGYKADEVPAGWQVQDAAIVRTAGGGDLVSRGEFGDFDFRFSFRISPNGNSGVMWHVLDGQPETYFSGPEYQVLDDLGSKPGPKHSVGALYDLVAPAADKVVRPAGSWNDGRILLQNGRLELWLNGKRTVESPCAGDDWLQMVADSKFKDWPFGKAASGRLALQDHGNEVAYRNLRIRRL